MAVSSRTPRNQRLRRRAKHQSAPGRGRPRRQSQRPPLRLKRPLEEDSTVQILTPKDEEALEVYRHSTAHLCAAAVLELPQTKLGIGPPIDTGFYYDFDRPEPFTPEDLEKIEAKDVGIQARNLTFK